MGASSRYGKYIKFITYLVTIVLINVVGITLYARIDLTANKATPSPLSVKRWWPRSRNR